MIHLSFFASYLFEEKTLLAQILIISCTTFQTKGEGRGGEVEKGGKGIQLALVNPPPPTESTSQPSNHPTQPASQPTPTLPGIAIVCTYAVIGSIGGLTNL